jgi:hypothetical protein
MSIGAAELGSDRRLFFTVTTGRSGTEYLARVLSLFRDVHAEHEPKPTFSSAFRTIAAAPETAREFWVAHKLPRIARSRAPIYAETSHFACKGFLESAFELGLRPTLVHLARPHRDVARSLLALGTIPARSFGGVRFYLAPTDDVRLPVERSILERWSDYQLCYWYCLEIAARARDYERLGLRVERVELASIATPEGVRELGARLELGPLSGAGKLRLLAIAGRRTNRKLHAKREIELHHEDLARWEREVERAIAAQSSSR